MRIMFIMVLELFLDFKRWEKVVIRLYLGFNIVIIFFFNINGV